MSLWNRFSSGSGTSSLIPVVAGKSAYVPSTGVAATDTAALQAAHDGFSSNGGTILLDSGPYVLTQDSLSFTKPIHLLGTGPNGPNITSDAYLTIGTTIQCASTTGKAIAVNVDGCTFEKLYIQNTNGSAPTGGAGIYFTQDVSATHNRNFRIIDCCISGFFINVDVHSGFYWIIDRCLFANPVAIGVRVADELSYDGGDQIITNSTFVPGPFTAATGSYAIGWHSGGGLRVTNCKINNSSVGGSTNFHEGIFLAVDDGVTTGQMIIANNSIENVTNAIICNLNGPSNTGVFNYILIANNFLHAATTNITVSPAVAGKIGTVTIEGNIFGGGTAFSFANVTNVSLDGVAFATASRPSAAVMRAGSWYYDTTLHKPGFADGSGNWKDATGTQI